METGVVPLTREQTQELSRLAEQTLQTPIATNTPKGVALEAARLATLAERARLEQREKALEARAREISSSSRPRRQLWPNETHKTF